MNLRHIDEFLETHSAGWKPFKGDFRLSKGSFKSLGRVAAGLFTGGAAFGAVGAAAGAQAGEGQNQNLVMKGQATKEAEAAAAARKAAHDAEVARLAEGSLGAIALRRRRGSAATRLTGSSMGGNAAPTGKTLLSQ